MGDVVSSRFVDKVSIGVGGLMILRNIQLSQNMKGCTQARLLTMAVAMVNKLESTP